jgi:hypothetical protein
VLTRYPHALSVKDCGSPDDTARAPLASEGGVILSEYATLMVEILGDNSRPEAGEVYGAMDMAWAKLVGYDEDAELFVSLRNSASRLPYDDRVRHPPPGRRKNWQARLFGLDALIIGSIQHRALRGMLLWLDVDLAGTDL